MMGPKFVLFLLSITLAQGVIYLGLSIWGLVMGKCSEAATNIADQPTLFAIDLLYLQGKHCGNPNVTIFGISEPVTLSLNWMEAEFIKLRTFIILILYTIISCLWIILSFACLSAVKKSRFEKPVNKCLSALWLLAILGGSIIDMIATYFYAYDIVFTTSAASTFQYLGITIDATVDTLTMSYLQEFDVYFTVPAITMTIVTCRCGILWIINIFGCGLCTSAMTNLPKKSKNAVMCTNKSGIETIGQSPAVLKEFDPSPILMIEETFDTVNSTNHTTN